MSNTYFKAMSVMGCEIGGITRRSLCRHNCCDGENCVTWLEKQFAKLNEYEEAKADGRLVKRGKWIYEHEWKCSSCGWAQSHDFNTIPNDILKYCPNCGAKMSKEEAEEALGGGE